jgi:RNA polymerase sigma factor (sigma-70 family)
MKRFGSRARSGAAADPQQMTGDERLQTLLAQYGGLLRRTIAKACPQAMGLSVDEIEQDARVQLWRALRGDALTGERDIVHPVSYIHKVAVSATIRAIRRVRARREDQLDEDERSHDRVPADALQAGPEASPEAAAERQEWLRKIDAAMTQLAENRRLAVGLHMQGLTTSEIGDILGWSEAKTRNLVHRGLKDLRRHLRAAGIEYGR